MGFLSGIGSAVGGVFGGIPGAVGGMFAGGGLNGLFKKDPLAEQLDAANREAAISALGFRKKLQGVQSQNLDDLQRQYGEIANGPSAETQANVEIERRRRMLGLGQQNQTMSLNQNIARRGLGNSAAGLFASQNQNANFNNQLADLESSRLGAVNEFQDMASRRRANILNQENALASSAQIPDIDFSKPKSLGQHLLDFGAPIVGQAAGMYLGGVAGGAAAAPYKQQQHQYNMDEIRAYRNY